MLLSPAQTERVAVDGDAGRALAPSGAEPSPAVSTDEAVRFIRAAIEEIRAGMTRAAATASQASRAGASRPSRIGD